MYHLNWLQQCGFEAERLVSVMAEKHTHHLCQRVPLALPSIQLDSQHVDLMNVKVNAIDTAHKMYLTVIVYVMILARLLRRFKRSGPVWLGGAGVGKTHTLTQFRPPWRLYLC